MVERRRGKIELDFGLLVTFQIIRLDNLLKKSTNYSMVWAGIFWFSVKITFYCVDFYQKCLWLKMHSLRFILLLHQYLLSMCTVIIHIWYGIGLVLTYLHRLQIQFISFKVGSKDANGTVDQWLIGKKIANPQQQFTIFDEVHYILLLHDILRNIIR